jgi:hypothetical protein
MTDAADSGCVDVRDERKELPLPAAPLLWDSPHVSRRIAAQRSRFMIFGSEPEWLSKLVNKNGARLREVTVPKENMNDIRYELRDAGVTESIIFPDLDGLGREIEQRCQSRSSSGRRSRAPLMPLSMYSPTTFQPRRAACSRSSASCISGFWLCIVEILAYKPILKLLPP